MKLDVVAKSREFACGTFASIAMTVWESTATPAHADLAVSLLNTLAVREKQVLLLAVLGSEAPPATAEIRSVISNEIRRLGDQVRGAASVVEGAGFRAAAMRGALIGMGLIVRQSYPNKIFSTVPEAATFLAGLEPRVTSASVAAAVAQLRG